MTIKNIIVASLIGICSVTASAQKISFDKQTITNNDVKWRQPSTAVFRFKNKGNTPVEIKNVDAGCGCLSAKWTRGAINKGESGEIAITYDAKLIGHFDRIIEVFTNLSDEPNEIRYKGVVSTGSYKTTSIEDSFPYAIDNIYLSASSIEFDDVNKGETKTAILEVYNASKQPYTPTLMHLPSFLTAKAFPEVIQRGRKGRIELTLHADAINDYGLTQNNIYLARFAGDKVGTNNDINISAVLLPDLTEQSGTADKPIFEISNTELYLGALGNKKSVKGVIKITNKGESPLKIDRVQAFNPAIMVNLAKQEIAPGESIKMQITVQAKYLNMSKAQPRVLIITNDPVHPKEVVTVMFE